MDRSEHEDRLKASGPALSGTATTKGGSTKRQRSNRFKSTMSTNTLLVVLLGLFFVGQIFLVTHPDPALSSTSSSSFLDPAAMKVSHQLAKQHQIESTTSSPLENEVLGPRKEPEPPHSQGEYETPLMNESTPSAFENAKEATTTTVSTPTVVIPTASKSARKTLAAAAAASVASANAKAVNKNSGDSDNESTGASPLMTMLHKAGLTNISQADLDTLPTWEQLTRQYGDLEQGPAIVGMDSCERYRQQTVHKHRRYAAPAGMFNTGTNAVAFHLEHNLQALQKWQVPWGKHRMESVRLTHIAPGFEKAIKEDAMPIVMIRDPLHWMQSMCKQPYNAEWPHRGGHCPNLVPTETEKPQPTGSVPVTIKFDKTSKFHWDSLVDLWNDWYRQYLVADYPRLMVRFEDLLFQAPAVMKQISECMGVDFDATTFRYQTNKAKNHGSGTDFLHAIIKSGNATARKKGMTEEDLKFAEQHLDADLMRLFQYQTPVELG